MKRYILRLLFFVSILNSLFVNAGDVMSWVPPYGISSCYSNLTNTTNTFWVKDALTHLGLQFWVPGDSGKVEYVSKYKYTYLGNMDSQVANFVTWGKQNNVKMLLCLFNTNEGDFDWSIAQKAFLTYPDSTIKNIMDQVNFHDLDGVDIDFEGVGSYASDKDSYANFLSKLNTELKAKGKYLSCDIFPTPCFNYPNPTWESAIASNVDKINVMGYADLYEASTTTYGWCATSSEAGKTVFKYSYVADFATGNQGISGDKISFGVPGWVATWGGVGIREHIYDMKNASTNAGIAIWDLQLSGNGQWKEEETWELLAQFKNDILATEQLISSNHLFSVENGQSVRVLKDNVMVKIVDVNGQLLLVKKSKAQELIILPNEYNGLFILTATNSIETQSQKLLILK